jgi:hypothetical protein
MIQNWRAAQLGVSESSGWNIDARGAARSLPEIITKAEAVMIRKDKSPLKSVRLWIVAAGLVAFLGTAFHQYQQYEKLGNNLAQIAASCAAKGGCSLPFYDY